ncbi:TrmH family RNA methyltransferase [Rhodococcus sp. NPDC019627]|jgi:tRNA G18 (ribose-2'-O)-methylase SpoU|uniref:TrmH family RNA methyltransferase n=1 Tax=unclassified Rhodococcus (in: high G+C Gram-positive bacteria) TaxID=192944 RepID=UPI002030BE36|nr:TrmH family RNA methyltransferase [Rhodococcus sp. MSC1_016]
MSRTPSGRNRPTSNLLVTARNARFQQWQSYLTNRSKRSKAGRFLIQGVRPLTLALDYEWPIESLLYRVDGPPLSEWARDVRGARSIEQIGVSAELMGELGEKADTAPELIAVAKIRAPRLKDLQLQASPLIVVFDRPSSPGNLGTLVRSANAFGADAVVVVGHGADPFDPQSVRASTGSLFAMPVVTVSSVDDILAFRDARRAAGTDLHIVGTDETGSVTIDAHDFTGGTLLVIGNETRGMSAAWRAACDTVVNIPIGGAASSLGAPSAGAVALYEIARQRR